MRHRFWLYLIAVFSSLPGCASVEESKQIGWDGVRWRMTKPEIRELFPQAHDYSFGVPYHKPLALFGFTEWNERGCASTVNFFFTREQLRTVSIELIQTTSAHDAACGRSWMQWLSSVWGQPVYHSSFKGFVFYSDLNGWRTASSDIILNRPMTDAFTMAPDVTFQPRGYYKDFERSSHPDRKRF